MLEEKFDVTYENLLCDFTCKKRTKLGHFHT